MKTSLRKYLSLVMVLCVAFVCLFAVNVKAATVVESVDFTAKSAKHSAYTDTWDYDGWTVSGGANNNGGWAYVKMGGKSTNLASYNTIYIASPVVTSASAEVTVNIIAGSVPKSGMSATVALEVYSDSTLKTLVDSTAAVTVAKTAAEVSFKPNNVSVWPANSYYKVVFNCTNTSTTNGIVWLDNVSIYDAAALSEPTVEISGTTFAEVNDGAQLTANTSNTTGSVVWTSSDNSVATVDQTGYVTAVAMGSATIIATVDGAEDSFEFKVYPEDGSELTIAEANEVAALAGTAYTEYKYVVEGVITEITGTTYGNMYITDGTNDLYIYGLYSDEEKTTRYDAMDPQPVVGDKIKIKAVLGQYGTSNQAKDAALVEIVADDDATAAVKEALNAVAAYMSLGYKYTKDVKDVAATTSVIAQYTDTTTTTNMKADANNATTIGLDETLFTVTSAKNNASNEVGLNKAGVMRLYANAAEQNGTSLTIATNNGQKISSIEVEFGTTVADITVNGVAQENAASTTYEYDVNATSVTIQNVHSTNVQVYIVSITINLESTDSGTVKVTEYSEVDFRMRFGVDSSLASIEGVDEYGIKVYTSSAEKSYASTSGFFTADQENSMYYVMISLGDALNNKDRLTEEFTVCAYVVIDGVTYESTTTKSYSILNMVIEYNELENPNVSELYNDLVASGDIAE